MDTERIDELIALAALGELSAADERELDAAARDDPSLAAQLGEAIAVAATLQRTAAEQPPVGLRASVLDAIAATPQEQIGATVVPFERAHRRLLKPILAAAAAVLLLVAGAVVVTQRDRGPDGILAVIEAPDAVTRVLDGALGGTLLVTYSPSEGAVVVEGQGVPVPAATSTYQLWVIRDDQPTSAGIFRPDDAGVVLARLDDVDPTSATLGVTEEPAGGSESPTPPILATA
jgi:anti-sigma-K factor RskA